MDDQIRFVIGLMLGLLSVWGTSTIVAAGAALSLVYDIPRIDRETVDAGDWGEAGFRVDALVDPEVGIRWNTTPAARFRVGWDNHGLRVRVEVSDSTPVESGPGWSGEGDSVVVFLARHAESGSPRVQYVLTPGRTPEHPKPAIKALYFNPSWILHTPADCRYAVHVKPEGYVAELSIPWSDIDVIPEPGLILGMQVQVSDENGDKRSFARWQPESAIHAGYHAMAAIRLAERPSAPVRFTAGMEFPLFREMSVRVLTDQTFSGRAVTLLLNGVASEAMFSPVQNSWSEAYLTCQLPSPEQTALTGLLTMPDGECLELPLTRLIEAKQAAFKKLEIRFDSYVFSGLTLPKPLFREPLLAELLAGVPELSVRYYDADGQAVTTAKRPGRYGAVVEVKGAGTSHYLYQTLYRVVDAAALEDWTRWFAMPLRLRFEGMDVGLGVAAPVWANDPGGLIGEAFKDFWYGEWRNEGFYAPLLATLSELDTDIAEGHAPVRPANRPQAQEQAYWYKLRKSLGESVDYEVILRKPKDYVSKSDNRWPLVVYLHGASPVDPESLEADGVWSNAALRDNLPFLLASPVCPQAEWPWQPIKVVALIEQLIRDEAVDPDRIYLTGVSMGGFGTWDIAAMYPELFAAIVPVCGGGNPDDMIYLKNLPVWAFHGAQDELVTVELTRKAVQALEATGGTVRYTEYPDAFHLIQLRTYAESELWTWLLAQRRTSTHQ